MFCYVQGIEVVMQSQDNAILVALLCSKTCGRHAFTGQVYVICFVMFYELW
jgi:hypothetical protein